jgi:hypothetical protein
MNDYTHDKSGRRLTSDERIARYEAKLPKPKPPAPARPLTPTQRSAVIGAEAKGRAEGIPKPDVDPNPWAKDIAHAEKSALTPADRRQLKRWKKWAKDWEQEQAAAEELAAAQKLKTSQPGYRVAVEHARDSMLSISEEYLPALAEAKGHLESSGDINTYWGKIVEIESEIKSKADAKMLALLQPANESMNKLNEASKERDDSAARIQQAKENQNESDSTN